MVVAMIVKASAADQAEIYQAYKRIFAFDDGGSIDFYFKQIFQPENCFLIKKDQQIVSALMAHKHQLNLHHRLIEVSLISGVYTLEAYRRQGYMQRLLKTVLDELSHQELITLIQAYDENLYRHYGFKNAYYKNHYTLYRDEVKLAPAVNIDKNFETLELVKLYELFTSRFTGYYTRSVADFNLYLQELASEQAKLLVYRDNGIAYGYVIFYEYLSHIKISEVIYLSKQALFNLLSSLFQRNNKLLVAVSAAEDWQSIFPKHTKETTCFMQARLNDATLFNRLYETDVSDISAALQVSGLPLFINQYW